MSKRFIPLGRLVATHGIEGWLKLKPHNPQSSVLSTVNEITLEKHGVCSPQLLEKSRAHKGHLLLKLRGVDEVDAARNLVGSTLLVGEESLPPLDAGEYYYYQAVGLDVFDTNNRWVGKVTNIWFKEGGDLYVVSGAAREHLIPAMKTVIEKIDLAAGKIIINPPEGLLDL